MVNKDGYITLNEAGELEQTHAQITRVGESSLPSALREAD